ncbi:MAG TPA: nitrate reductase molybdenum cofactor assembly chaperone [Microlunatus sp.]
MRGADGIARADRVVWQAASLVLGYPDDELVGRAGLIRAALADAAPVRAADFDAVWSFWGMTASAAVQNHYVEIFDLSRRHTLYLSYYTDGDTRRRGETLMTIKQRYRCSGFLVDTHGELPDYLPLILEYAARVDPRDGAELLQDFRRSLELLRLALVDKATPYAGVIAAVCATLPGPSPRDRQAVMAMAAAGPPTETVGLEPADPRLLPMRPVNV